MRFTYERHFLMFKYAKAWTAVTTAALVLLGAAVGLDSTVYTVAVTIIGALGVFFIPNTPSTPDV